MEFFGELDEQVKPCNWCGKMTWIYVLKKTDNTSNKASNKEIRHYCCNNHYLELLTRYFDYGDTSGFELFPQELNILEMPVQAAQIEFGSNIPLKYLIQMYLEKIDEKLKQINHDLENLGLNNNELNKDDDFIFLLLNDKSEKEIIKIVTQILIKEHRIS